MKKNIISLLITSIIGFIIYYFTLPAINIHSLGFWTLFIGLLIVYLLTLLIQSIDLQGRMKEKYIEKISGIIVIWIGIIIVGIIGVDFVLSPIFNSSSYSKRINIDEKKEFTESIAPVDFNSIPLLDKASSQKLGDRTMGQMPELVSQFYVSDLYTQINLTILL